MESLKKRKTYLPRNIIEYCLSIIITHLENYRKDESAYKEWERIKEDNMELLKRELPNHFWCICVCGRIYSMESRCHYDILSLVLKSSGSELSTSQNNIIQGIGFGILRYLHIIELEAAERKEVLEGNKHFLNTQVNRVTRYDLYMCQCGRISRSKVCTKCTISY